MATNDLQQSPTPLRYAEIAQHVRRLIETDALRPGDRLPSLRTLRRQYGVTQATVDRAHAVLEEEGLIVRSPRSGIFVSKPGQRPATGIIGFSGPYSAKHNFSPYWTYVVEGAETAAHEAKNQILLLKGDVTSGWEKADGVLLNGMQGATPAHLIPASLPVVSLFIPATFRGPAVERQRAMRQTGLVTTDDYMGMYAAVRHLLSLGHRRIAYLNNTRSDVFLCARRVAGYQDALREAAIDGDPRWMRALPVPSPSLYFMNTAREAMRQWLRDDWESLGCTALLAHNDDAAWGVIEALREGGIDVPGQVSVVGFDGTEIAECCTPPLTTVEVPLHEIGRVGIGMLLSRVRDGGDAQTVVLPTTLRVRGSTAPPAP